MAVIYASPIPRLCTDAEWSAKIMTQTEVVRGWVAAYAQAVRCRQAVARDEANRREIESIRTPIDRDAAYAVSERIVLGIPPVTDADAPENDGWDHDEEEVPCHLCDGTGVAYIAPDELVDPCGRCAGFGFVFPTYDAQTRDLVARKREREMAEAKVCREASEAAVAFGGYDDLVVERVIPCKGIVVSRWDGGSEECDGCAACHFTGWTFHNGEPHAYCGGCEAGRALAAWSKTMDQAERHAYPY